MWPDVEEWRLCWRGAQSLHLHSEEFDKGGHCYRPELLLVVRNKCKLGFRQLLWSIPSASATAEPAEPTTEPTASTAAAEPAASAEPAAAEPAAAEPAAAKPTTEPTATPAAGSAHRIADAHSLGALCAMSGCAVRIRPQLRRVRMPGSIPPGRRVLFGASWRLAMPNEPDLG